MPGIKFGRLLKAVDRMGDKASAKKPIVKLGVPVVPSSVGILESFEQAQELARSFGYQ
jgi:acetyl-CoA carboxylase biotin carboxylase subunit